MDIGAGMEGVGAVGVGITVEDAVEYAVVMKAEAIGMASEVVKALLLRKANLL